MSERDAQTHLPVFVGGFRSGSTLLINLLGLHDDIAPWFETKCLAEALRWIKILEDPAAAEIESLLANPPGPEGFGLESVLQRMLLHAKHTDERLQGKAGNGKASHEHYPIGTDCIGYSFKEFSDLVDQWRQKVESADPQPSSVAGHTGQLIKALGDLHLQRLGGRIWVNKTPEMPRLANELRMCLGECKVVHLIRDGREVALSGAGLNWGSPRQIAWYWAGMIEESRRAAKGHEDNYLEVRYEQLIEEPDSTLDRVLEFVGVLPDSTLRTRYEQLSGRAICPAARQFKASDAISDNPLLHEITEVAHDMLVELGYIE